MTPEHLSIYLHARFAGVLRPAEIALLVEVFGDVRRAARAEGILACMELLGPYVSPDLRPSAAVVAARASMLALVEERGDAPS